MVDLRRLAFDKSLTQSELGDILQIPQPEVSKLMNGRRDFTQAHINLLSAHFGEDVIAHYIIDDNVMDEYRRLKGKTVEATIIPAEIVEEIKDEVHNEHCSDCKAAVPYVSKDLVQSRNADIREMVLQQSPELQFKLIHELFGNANYIQKVITSAMMPLFQPGDLLFVKFLPDNAKLISGAIYLLDTKTYGAMVRQVTVDGDMFYLHSLNPDYEELALHRDEIFSISLVEKSLRSDFNMPTTVPNVVDLMSRRDAQIDRLIEQIDKAGERESRLIKLLETNK